MEPDWTAQLDQTLAATRDFAKQAAAFYKGLVEEGLGVEVAVAMTNSYVQSLVIASGIFGGDEEQQR